MATNTEVYAGSRYYACAGDWSLPDVTATGEQVISTANPVKQVPPTALSIILRGKVVMLAIGVGGNTHGAAFQSLSEAGVPASEFQELSFGVTEPSGVTVGNQVGVQSFRLICPIVNHVTNPEFILDVGTLPASTTLASLGILGYYMP